jgi:hypothetical protein
MVVHPACSPTSTPPHRSGEVAFAQDLATDAVGLEAGAAHRHDVLGLVGDVALVADILCESAAPRGAGCAAPRRRLDRLLWDGAGPSGTSRVGGSVWLDQEDVSLLVGLGAVLDAARHDEEIAFLELDIAVT